MTFPQLVSTTAKFAGLTDLVTALKATGLVPVVDETKDLTVFAPTNAAFEKLGPAAANLTMEQLTDVLGYHGLSPFSNTQISTHLTLTLVVSADSPLYSTDFEDGDVIETLQGQSVKVSIKNGKIFVNNAEVIVPNVLVANGVVHVIDR